LQKSKLTYPANYLTMYGTDVDQIFNIQIKSNQIKLIFKCKNSAHSKHVMHLVVKQGV